MLFFTNYQAPVFFLLTQKRVEFLDHHRENDNRLYFLRECLFKEHWCFCLYKFNTPFLKNFVN